MGNITYKIKVETTEHYIQVYEVEAGSPEAAKEEIEQQLEDGIIDPSQGNNTLNEVSNEVSNIN